MQVLKTILSDAAAQGLVPIEQAGKLADYLASRGVTAPVSSIRADSLSAPNDRDSPDVMADLESPRFIRGFHDVLITIGIIVALVGVWGLGSFYAGLPAIIILAEVLVRRQRLALPAVALTIAFVQWTSVVAQMLLAEYQITPESVLTLLVTILPTPVLLVPFYWRYRVPLSLALLLATASASLLLLVFFLLERASGSPDFVFNHRLLSVGLCLLAALALFACAMRYDLADPKRETRRSDVAFWLHLAAAPAMLYSVLALIFIRDIDGFSVFPDIGQPGHAATVVAIVCVFMAVGLIIDRRAFVTSGLLSLGYAIYVIFDRVNMRADIYIFVTVLAVGIVVLTIGVGWSTFRRQVFRLFPDALKQKLPPLR